MPRSSDRSRVRTPTWTQASARSYEREVEAAGAETADEIRAAVKAGWKKVTPQMCVAISHRVRKNMAQVIRLKGGNFYDE